MLHIEMACQIDAWKNEHPLTMRPNGVMGPLDIFNAINEQFDDAIIVTDVGQHQMLTSQYVDITENRQIIMSGGLGTMGYAFRARSEQKSATRTNRSSRFPVTAVCR